MSVATVAVAVAVVVSAVSAQQDLDRVVPGGGITGNGWHGNVIDANSLKQGRAIGDSKFTASGNTIDINAGPNAIYWNTEHRASGNFTVKATFAETNHLKHSSHAHPYGVFIGGENLDTAKANLLYCAAYGNGTFIFRGFAPDSPNGVFRLGGNRATANEAIHKAGADGTVTQEIAITVAGDTVSCSVNGTQVASHPKADVVGAGKLASTDGFVGLRIGHNLDVKITNFSLTRQ
jgi:hypothetical protein